MECFYCALWDGDMLCYILNRRHCSWCSYCFISLSEMKCCWTDFMSFSSCLLLQFLIIVTLINLRRKKKWNLISYFNHSKICLCSIRNMNKINVLVFCSCIMIFFCYSCKGFSQFQSILLKENVYFIKLLNLIL